MNKEEKRKMKTLELNSKEDFQYYLYQLICRGGCGRFLGPGGADAFLDLN